MPIYSITLQAFLFLFMAPLLAYLSIKGPFQLLTLCIKQAAKMLEAGMVLFVVFIYQVVPSFVAVEIPFQWELKKSSTREFLFAIGNVRRARFGDSFYDTFIEFPVGSS